jgi:hypothetical protein
MLILLVGLPSVPAQVKSQGQKPLPTQIPQHHAILVGSAWYPEQRPESRSAEDLRLMEAATGEKVISRVLARKTLGQACLLQGQFPDALPRRGKNRIA